MDIVDFFKKQTEHWDAEGKCGFCWEFGAPLEEAEANKQQTERGCCVNVFLTDLKKDVVRGYSSQTGFQNSRADNYSFTLYVLKRDELGKNNYNEIIGHPIDESRWETILKPLQECVTEEGVLEFCNILGINIDIPRWSMSTKINYLDDNYTGWMIRATFREKIQ